MNKTKTCLLLSMRTITFIILFVSLSILTHTTTVAVSKYWTVIVVCCNIITLFALYLYCKKQQISYLDLINLKKTRIRTVLLMGVVIAIVDFVGSFVFGLIFKEVESYSMEIIMQAIPVWIAVLVLLLMPITSTMAEEGLYLGVGIHKADAVYLSIFFYALQHAFFPMVLDVKYMLYRMVVFLPSIILMCVYYHKKKEILPIMFEHFTVNLITIMQILLSSL